MILPGLGMRFFSGAEITPPPPPADPAIEVATIQFLNSNSADAANLAPSWGAANNLWIAAYSLAYASSYTWGGPPTGYTQEGFAGGTNNTQTHGWTYSKTSMDASDNPAAISISSINEWSATTVAIKGLSGYPVIEGCEHFNGGTVTGAHNDIRSSGLAGWVNLKESFEEGDLALCFGWVRGGTAAVGVNTSSIADQGWNVLATTQGLNNTSQRRIIALWKIMEGPMEDPPTRAIVTDCFTDGTNRTACALLRITNFDYLET